MPRSKNKIVRRLLKTKPSETPAWAISLAQDKPAKKIGDVHELCYRLESDVARVTAIHLALLDTVPVRHATRSLDVRHLL